MSRFIDVREQGSAFTVARGMRLEKLGFDTRFCICPSLGLDQHLWHLSLDTSRTLDCRDMVQRRGGLKSEVQHSFK